MTTITTKKLKEEAMKNWEKQKKIMERLRGQTVNKYQFLPFLKYHP